MSGGALGLAAGTLRLVPHDPDWARRFETEAARLSYLPGGARVHHIGSTSVPGLPAKPILDLMVTAQTSAWGAVATALRRAGYRDNGPRGDRGGHVFVREDDGVRTHILHLYVPDDPDVANHLDFRDALRADAGARSAYADRKARLIASGIPRRRYADAKGGVVSAILQAWRAREP